MSPGRSTLPGLARLLVLYAFVGVLLAISRPTPALVAAGAAVAGAGEALRVWAAGHLVKSVRLVTSGPYAYTRNPLYLGRLLILTGLLIAARLDVRANLALLAAAYALFFLYYLPRKERIEGTRLRLRHGDAFARYARVVPRLLPSWRRYPGEPGGWSARLMARNREPAVALGLLLVFGLLAWKSAGR